MNSKSILFCRCLFLTTCVRTFSAFDQASGSPGEVEMNFNEFAYAMGHMSFK